MEEVSMSTAEVDARLDNILKDIVFPTSKAEPMECKLYDLSVPEPDGWIVVGKITPPKWFINISANLEELRSYMMLEEDYLPRSRAKYLGLLLTAARDFMWAKLNLSLPEDFMRRVGKKAKTEAEATPGAKGALQNLNYISEQKTIAIKYRFDGKDENGDDVRDKLKKLLGL